MTRTPRRFRSRSQRRATAAFRAIASSRSRISTDAAINVGAAGTVDSTSGYLNNLLLYPFEDDGTGTIAEPTLKSQLCVGCHNGVSVAMTSIDGVTNAPPGTHPLRSTAAISDTVSAAVDAGRVPTLLVTTAANGTYADQASSPNLTSYPGADRMDCDSCHRTHGADSDSSIATGNREYILEQATSGNLDAICSQCHLVYGTAAAQ